MIHSYPTIYNLGHPAVAELTKGPVIVEEKVDGSQISFGLDENGDIQMRSKGATLNVVAPEGMFQRAVMSVMARKKQLRPGVVYRGEYLNTPHHNALTYDRVPNGNIIIFDVGLPNEAYYTPEEKRALSKEIDMECVPVLFRGVISDVQQFRDMLETQSVLGGQKIEGVVIKPEHYDLFGRDKKPLMGKFVSEAFREVHTKTWDSEHRTKGPTDILQMLRDTYAMPARWNKAVQHLRDAGQLTNSPKDIGNLLKEVQDDTAKECEDEIKAQLFAWCWPQLRRSIVYGLPEWYKEELLKRQFDPSNKL